MRLMKEMVCGLNTAWMGADQEIKYRTVMRIYAEGRTAEEAEDLADTVIGIVKKLK